MRVVFIFFCTIFFRADGYCLFQVPQRQTFCAVLATCIPTLLGLSATVVWANFTVGATSNVFVAHSLIEDANV